MSTELSECFQRFPRPTRVWALSTRPPNRPSGRRAAGRRRGWPGLSTLPSSTSSPPASLTGGTQRLLLVQKSRCAWGALPTPDHHASACLAAHCGHPVFPRPSRPLRTHRVLACPSASRAMQPTSPGRTVYLHTTGHRGWASPGPQAASLWGCRSLGVASLCPACCPVTGAPDLLSWMTSRPPEGPPTSSAEATELFLG